MLSVFLVMAFFKNQCHCLKKLNAIFMGFSIHLLNFTVRLNSIFGHVFLFQFCSNNITNQISS